MNRAERRRIEKEKRKKPAVYNITQEQLQTQVSHKLIETRKDIATEIIDKVVNDYLALTLNVLYDKFDFDKDKLLDFRNEINSLSDGVTGDFVDVEDIKLMLIEELDINLFKSKSCETSLDKDERLSKADNHKRKIVNSGVWLSYMSSLMALKELYKFGGKRGADFTISFNGYLSKYLENPKLLVEDINNEYDNGTFKDCEMLLNSLPKNEVSE